VIFAGVVRESGAPGLGFSRLSKDKRSCHQRVSLQGSFLVDGKKRKVARNFKENWVYMDDPP